MTILSLRHQLQQQIEALPDDLVTEIADFTAFLMARRRGGINYSEWGTKDWNDFSQSQFLRETELDIEYRIEDAEEVFSR